MENITINKINILSYSFSSQYVLDIKYCVNNESIKKMTLADHCGH